MQPKIKNKKKTAPVYRKFPFPIKQPHLFSAYMSLFVILVGSSTFTGEAGHGREVLKSPVKSKIKTHFPGPAECTEMAPCLS